MLTTKERDLARLRLRTGGMCACFWFVGGLRCDPDISTRAVIALVGWLTWFMVLTAFTYIERHRIFERARY